MRYGTLAGRGQHVCDAGVDQADGAGADFVMETLDEDDRWLQRCHAGAWSQPTTRICSLAVKRRQQHLGPGVLNCPTAGWRSRGLATLELRMNAAPMPPSWPPGFEQQPGVLSVSGPGTTTPTANWPSWRPRRARQHALLRAGGRARRRRIAEERLRHPVQPSSACVHRHSAIPLPSLHPLVILPRKRYRRSIRLSVGVEAAGADSERDEEGAAQRIQQLVGFRSTTDIGRRGGKWCDFLHPVPVLRHNTP